MEYSGLDIGKMLKEARESRKLTQEDLALKINKKRSYISRVETNATGLNFKTLQKIVEQGLGGKIRIEL